MSDLIRREGLLIGGFQNTGVADQNIRGGVILGSCVCVLCVVRAG